MVCPYCGQDLRPEHDKCPNCSAPVKAEDRQAAEARSSAGLGREAPPAGTRVVARWTNGLWYPGVVDQERGPARHVTFDDGDQGWVGPQDLTTESDPPDDGGGALMVGARVEGQWADRNWYPGSIDDRCGLAWHVRFDDGDLAWLDGGRLRRAGVAAAPRAAAVTRGGGSAVRAAIVGIVLVVAIGTVVLWTLVERSDESGAGPAPGTAPAASLPIVPMVPFDAPPAPGTRVLAPYGSRGFYFVGTVRSIGADGQAQILYLDGDQGVAPAAALRQENIGPGSRVHAQVTSSQGWYAGQVTERQGDRVNIHFDDGDVQWVDMTAVRHEPPPSAR